MDSSIAAALSHVLYAADCQMTDSNQRLSKNVRLALILGAVAFFFFTVMVISYW